MKNKVTITNTIGTEKAYNCEIKGLKIKASIWILLALRNKTSKLIPWLKVFDTAINTPHTRALSKGSLPRKYKSKSNFLLQYIDEIGTWTTKSSSSLS